MNVATKLNRRKFTIAAAAAGLALRAPAVIRAQSKELRILTWEGYAEPEWVDSLRGGDWRLGERGLHRVRR